MRPNMRLQRTKIKWGNVLQNETRLQSAFLEVMRSQSGMGFQLPQDEYPRFDNIL